MTKIYKRGSTLTENVGVFDGEETDGKSRDEVLKDLRDAMENSKKHDQTLEDSFPSSDPPSSNDYN
jgi:hypothetical protein